MSEPRRVSPWYLQPRDQRMIAAILCVAFIALVGYWWLGSWRHGWIEIDSAERQTVEFQIDLNSAEWSEFSQLPGVGETLARRIVERRQQSGPYRNADELLKVQGVGKKTLERIKPFLVINATAVTP